MYFNLKVQTRQWACNYAGVTCNCGAVLRDHNDVIEFNCCNKDLKFQNTHPTPLQVKIRSPKCLRPGINVLKKSNGGNIAYTVRIKCNFSILTAFVESLRMQPLEQFRPLTAVFVYLYISSIS